jgi:hypothetical protein
MKALIIYDDFISAAKANEALQSSAQADEVKVQWDIKPHRIDRLKSPATAEEVLDDAIDAHLIVFAGHRPHPMPPWLARWLEQWAEYRQIKNVAIAVVCAGDADESSPPATGISRFAARHGLDFIYDGNVAMAQSLAEDR